MRRLALLLLFPLAGTVGCQAITGKTLTEEMPADLNGVPVSQPTTGVVVNPVQIPIPTPGKPQPTPTPTPTPGTPSPTPSATPTPAPAPTPTPNTGGAPAFHHLRVAFFGVDCRNGKTEPNNGARQVPQGCVGYVTATPKDANNVDVPASIHGPNISWSLEYGDNVVDVRESIFPNDFNRDVHGKRVGPWQLCATVKNVRGCLSGEVTP
jgi:hypothetical protein